MSEWRESRLGDVLTLQRGFDLPARDRIDGPYPIVSSSGITGHHAVAKLEPPGVVIGRYGSLGSVHWVTEPYWPHNTALWVKDFKGNDPRYTSYLLQTISHDGSTASAVPGINRNHLHALSVRVPDTETQRGIAGVLAAFDELIATNERRIELLEAVARSLYHDLFERGPQSTPGSGGDGWPRRPASEIFTINPRLRSNQSSFRKVTMADVDERHAAAFPSQTVGRAAGSRFQQDDVLLARITPCLENGKTALVKFLDPGEVAVGSTEFIVLRGNSVGPAFTYCAARSDRLREHAIASMSGASGRQRVSVDAFRSLELVEPPNQIAAAFEHRVGPLLDEAYVLECQSRALARTRDLLLPRLVTGRLDISDLDLGDFLFEEAG